MKTETEKLSAPEWITELAERELTSSQKAALTDWLRESPIHVRDFLQLTLLHQDLAALPIDVDELDTWVREARSTALAPIPLSTLGERMAPKGEGGRDIQNGKKTLSKFFDIAFTYS